MENKTPSFPTIMTKKYRKILQIFSKKNSLHFLPVTLKMFGSKQPLPLSSHSQPTVIINADFFSRRPSCSSLHDMDKNSQRRDLILYRSIYRSIKAVRLSTPKQCSGFPQGASLRPKFSIRKARLKVTGICWNCSAAKKRKPTSM